MRDQKPVDKRPFNVSLHAYTLMASSYVSEKNSIDLHERLLYMNTIWQVFFSAGETYSNDLLLSREEAENN